MLSFLWFMNIQSTLVYMLGGSMLHGILWYTKALFPVLLCSVCVCVCVLAIALCVNRVAALRSCENVVFQLPF